MCNAHSAGNKEATASNVNQHTPPEPHEAHRCSAAARANSEPPSCVTHGSSLEREAVEEVHKSYAGDPGPPSAAKPTEPSATVSSGRETQIAVEKDDSLFHESHEQRNTSSSDIGDGVAGDDDSAQVTPKMREQFVKTKMCPHYSRGYCIHGAGCTYAHATEELRPLPDLQKTKLCESVTRSYPCRNPNCTYAHSRDELRATRDLVAYKTSLCFFHKKGRCLNGEKCRFAHGDTELRSKCEAGDDDSVSGGRTGGDCTPHLGTRDQPTLDNSPRNLNTPSHHMKGSFQNHGGYCHSSPRSRHGNHAAPPGLPPPGHGSEDEKDHLGTGYLSGTTTASSSFNASPRENPESPRAEHEREGAMNSASKEFLSYPLDSARSSMNGNQPFMHQLREDSNRIVQTTAHSPRDGGTQTSRHRRHKGKGGGSVRAAQFSSENYHASLRQQRQWAPAGPVKPAAARSKQWPMPATTEITGRLCFGNQQMAERSPKPICYTADLQAFTRQQTSNHRADLQQSLPRQQTSGSVSRNSLSNTFLYPKTNPTSFSFARFSKQNTNEWNCTAKNHVRGEYHHVPTQELSPTSDWSTQHSSSPLAGRGLSTTGHRGNTYNRSPVQATPTNRVPGQSLNLPEHAGDGQACPVPWSDSRSSAYCRGDLNGSGQQPVLSQIQALKVAVQNRELENQLVNQESTFYED